MKFIPPYDVCDIANISGAFHLGHWADLQSSGLNEETIRLGKAYSIAPRFLSYFFSFSGQSKILPLVQTGLCFPYQGDDFARLKIFPPVGRMRYAQPPGTSARLYVPRMPEGDRVIIAEGEKKTLSAIQHGLNAVGVGGVWSWVRKGSPIDDFALIDWDGRDVEIVPDSDVWSRPDLLRAIYALGREVENRGAYVTLVMLLPDGNRKTGLDDFFVAGAGVGDFEGLERVDLRQDPLNRCHRWYVRWRIQKELAA